MPVNTGESRTNSGQFKKGDPRINRKGRPRSFDAVRQLAQIISHKKAVDKEGNPIVVDGELVTVVQAILLSWSNDRDKQKDFMEWAYGKVPNEVDVTSGGKPLEFDYAKFINTATRPISDSNAPSQDEGSVHGETLGKDGDGGSAGG
jgi:hypothetical protein